jgi:hypothetical protein
MLDTRARRRAAAWRDGARLRVDEARTPLPRTPLRADAAARFGWSHPRAPTPVSQFRLSTAIETDLSSRVNQQGVPLDMDVIDTSWMDSNVQELRHNYFNVNRYMIDDIRELISTKRRAHLRTGRLTHRRGNVWSFLSAPKHIVNS